MKAEITLPESLNEIKLSNFMKLIKVAQDNPDAHQFIAQKQVEYLCEIHPDIISKMKQKDFQDICTHINTLLESEKLEFQNTFKHNGIEFGFVPNLDDLTVGEFADLTNYFTEDRSTMDKAMAVLYRPITKKHKSGYQIEYYEGTDKHIAHIKTMPLGIALGAEFFFHNLGLELSRTILKSSEKESEAESKQLQQILEQSGVGISLFTHSLEGMLYELKLPQN